MKQYAEIQIDGVITVITKKPKVTWKGDVITVVFSPTMTVRLSPDAAGDISNNFGDWQYEMYS